MYVSQVSNCFQTVALKQFILHNLRLYYVSRKREKTFLPTLLEQRVHFIFKVGLFV